MTDPMAELLAELQRMAASMRRQTEELEAAIKRLEAGDVNVPLAHLRLLLGRHGFAVVHVDALSSAVGRLSEDAEQEAYYDALEEALYLVSQARRAA